MQNYTEYVEGLIFQYDDNEQLDYEYKDIFEVLNNEFRSFGEALEIYISKQQFGESNLTAAEYLKRKSTEKGITIASYNTYNNWFKEGLRPKKSEASREAMYKIAFSLDLDVDRTIELFHKVYLDRAFNNRSYKELIYYYCIANHYGWDIVQDAIRKISFEKIPDTDQTLHTVKISEEARKAKSITDLIRFINQNPHNFSLNNITAKSRIKHYLELAREDAKEEAHRDYIAEYYRNMNTDSVNFLFLIMTDQNNNGNKGTKPVSFKGSILPMEIKSNFPNPNSLSNENASHEELRKVFILLFSYDFWYKQQLHSSIDIFDDYVSLINYELNLIGYPPLYSGNPYDWLFLFCTFSENPLDTFRSILGTALHSRDFQ